MPIDPGPEPPDYPSPPVHVWARSVIKAACEELFPGVEFDARTLQMIQANACAESYYGKGWKNDMRGSNNWGAIQGGSPKNGVCPANSQLYKDHKLDKDGNKIWYEWCYRTYPTPTEGAKHLIELMTVKRPSVLNAMRNPDSNIYDVCKAMFDTQYYGTKFLGGGQIISPELQHKQISDRVKACGAPCKTISAALGEPNYWPEVFAPSGSTSAPPSPGTPATPATPATPTTPTTPTTPAAGGTSASPLALALITIGSGFALWWLSRR